MCEGYFIAVAEETLEQKLLVRHHGQSNMEVCGGVLTDAPGCPSQSSFVIVAFCILILQLVLGFFLLLLLCGFDFFPLYARSVPDCFCPSFLHSYSSSF